MATKRHRTGEFTAQFLRRLREARELARLTQDNMAERLGISRSGYARWESGDVKMILEDVARVSVVLRVPVDWLLGLDSKLTEDEGRLLMTFRALDERGRMIVLGVAKDAGPQSS